MARALACTAVVFLAALAACSGRTRLLEPLTGPAGPRYTAADFRAPGAADRPPPSVAAAPLPSGTAAPSSGLPGSPALAAGPAPRQPTPTIDVIPGPPDLGGPIPPPVETAALLDEKVGDINGRPIFASEFFAPYEAQFIAEARDYRRADWVNIARERIAAELSTKINQELLRAEALESIPVQAREVGLARFLESRRANLQSEAGGSLTEAQQRLLAERGLTVEQWLQELEDQQLVVMSLQGLRQQVQISARDIQNYYDRNHDVFNPPPSARLLEIVVLTANTDAVAQVQQALAGGTPFADLAAGPLNGSTFRAQGGRRTIPLTGEYAQTNLFNNDALNQAAWGLRPGGWAGPIAYGSTGQLTAWLYLEGIEASGRSLYEVQTTIIETLRLQELETRTRELVERLRERASFTSEEVMARRLLEIAIARYYPPGQPEPQNPRQPPGPGRRP